MKKVKIKKATMWNQEVTAPKPEVRATFYNVGWLVLMLYLALEHHWITFWLFMLACPAFVHFWRWRNDKKELVARHNANLVKHGLLHESDQ